MGKSRSKNATEKNVPMDMFYVDVSVIENLTTRTVADRNAQIIHLRAKSMHETYQ